MTHSTNIETKPQHLLRDGKGSKKLILLRYVLDICYQGTAYAGWQIQHNAHSVQAELQTALSTLLQKEMSCTGAGRTDSGVHARQLMVHFDEAAALPPQFQQRLNSLLPTDIAIKSLYQAENPDFHTRFSATHRAYVYQLIQHKSPFFQTSASWIRQDLAVADMQQAADLLLQYEDFASFCKSRSGTTHYLCRMDHAYFQQEGELLCFHIGANRFLRGMVRAIVGSLLWVGMGKWSVAEFQQRIEARDRRQAGPNAEAKGLFLTEVRYPEGSFVPFVAE